MLRSGLLAIGIAVSALGGAATGPSGLNGGLLFETTPVWASLEPVPGKTHKVQSGENDWTISKKYGVSVDALHKANPGTNWRALQIGQSLTIPVSGSSSTSVKATGGMHAVSKGENDNTIAKKYGVTVAQIHAVNPGVDWRKLQIGQKIKLPGGAENTSNIKTISTGKVKITSGTVNVRTEPTTSSAVRTSVTRGTVATVLDKQGAWYELRFPKGTTGWVRGDLLSAVAEKPAGAGSSTPKTTTVAAAKSVNAGLAASLIDTAKEMLGVRYKWGGTSRGGVDCSGLTTFVFSKNGITLPRTSIEQSKIGQRVDKEDLQAGDLLFFITGRRGSRINHVGIYIGDGKFIHSSSYKHRVVTTSLSDYNSGYAGARRVKALQVAEAPVVKPDIATEDEKEVSVEVLFPSRIVYGADKTGK
jgi:cell wall-associated NlpC family hydrolase